MPAMDYSRVARYYDLYAHTRLDVPFFLEAASGCRNVLELTSGTGRLSIPLIEAGVNLTCLDSSPEMLAILRAKLAEKGLHAPVYEMDACRFTISERFDLIILPFNSFAEITDPPSQLAALAAARAHLGEHGRFICTFHNPAVRLKMVDGKTHPRGEYALPDAEGSLSLSSREVYDPDTRLVSGEQIYRIVSPQGDLISEWSVDILFHLHSRETFETLARSVGFEVEALYGDYSGGGYQPEQSPFMIFVLRGTQEPSGQPDPPEAS